VVLNNSRIVANAYEGTGGNIRINAGTYIADLASVVDASSALGIDGVVEIKAAVNEVSGVLNPLPSNFVNATALLREPCMARIRGESYSSFTITGREGLPLEPGGYLPGIFH
jgi:large exoprotein involved in heme utilization and adhesion